MKCPKCGFEMEEGMKFCPQCGGKAKIVCPGCGKEVDDKIRFCPECGKPLQNVENNSVFEQYQDQQKVTVGQMEVSQTEIGSGKADLYEKGLEERAQKETWGNIIAFSIMGILCLILTINNWGYSDLMEIVIMCGGVSLIILAVYSAIAAGLGFYGANKYLHKYRQMKEEIGKVEAVKMIEQQYKPEEGFALLKGGANATGGCIGGCLSSVVGFAVTIIAVILLMAFC